MSDFKSIPPPPVSGDLIKTLSPVPTPDPVPDPVTVSAPVVTKPGWYTSEFFLTALTTIGVFAALLIGRISVEDVVLLWPIFGGNGLYAIGRGIAKKAGG